MSTESVWLTHLPLVLGWVRPLPRDIMIVTLAQFVPGPTHSEKDLHGNQNNASNAKGLASLGKRSE